MIRSFDSLAFRQLRTRRLRVLLTAFGIVLGVGMVFGVLLLTGTIRHTFDQLITSAWGETDLVVLPSAGGTMPERTLTEARQTPGVKQGGGMVGAVFTRIDPQGHVIKGQSGRMLVAGIDPAAPPYDFHYLRGRPLRLGSLPEIVVEDQWAKAHGVDVGTFLMVATPKGREMIRVAGVFRFGGGVSFGGQGFAGVPIDYARRILDLPSGYNQIALKVTDRAKVDQIQKRLQARLGSGVDVKTPEGVSKDLAKQVQGLNVVLYFFSAIALFVGGFLILNSFNMTVLQRMREIGTLRTLGATRGMVVRSVLTEALAIGAVGSVLGLGLGAVMSLGLLAMMRGLGMPVGDLQFSLVAAVAAVAVGLLATTVGALRPARRAGRIAPIRAVLGAGARKRRPRTKRALVGLALFLPGLVFGGRFWFSNGAGGSGVMAAAGMLGTMLMFLGMTLAAPYLIMPLVRGLAHPLRRIAPTGGRLAADSATSNPARTAATAVALTIGLSVIVVNAAMSTSFISTISNQIDAQYARDFTVTPIGTTLTTAAGIGGGGEARHTPPSMHGSAAPTPVRAELAKLPGTGSEPGLAVGVDPRQFPIVDKTPIRGGDRTRAYAGMAAGGVIVGRAYETATGRHVGDTILLRGPTGTVRAPITGVFDTMASSEAMTVHMSLATLHRVYGTDRDTQLLVKARSEGDRAALGRRISAYLDRTHPNLEMDSTGEVKSRIKSEISQQFNLFNAILAIAVVVSLLGVVNTLAMSVLERTREIGVLRALGSSRWQVRLTMLDESLLITLAGAIAGVVIGALIAVVWVSGLGSLLPGIEFHVPLGTIVLIAVTAIVLGVLAAILPARRAAKLKPVEALSYE